MSRYERRLEFYNINVILKTYKICKLGYTRENLIEILISHTLVD